MLYNELITVFYENRDPLQAVPMAAYMKNQFPYLGLPKPKRTRLGKEFIKQARKQKTIDWDLVFSLWDLQEREFQYLAVDYLLSLHANLQKADITHIESLLISKSWWDTVDILATNITGALCAQKPELIQSHILKWAESDNIWLVRTSILFQLKYKAHTDTEVLGSVIIKNSSTREFFINKAIGWALREYSKTNKEWVQAFLANHTLHSLSMREASKHL
ncbi:MAG TPA: DNA alkylation repair protein [Syntrophomonadaceae bacterium]|nr:DNA alkylation repair protein [Syntrophomonadaceae bacterium]